MPVEERVSRMARSRMPRGSVTSAWARTRSASAGADDLLGLEPAKKSEGAVGNRRLARRLQQIEKLPRRDQQAILRTIDAFLAKGRWTASNREAPQSSWFLRRFLPSAAVTASQEEPLLLDLDDFSEFQ